MRIIPRPDEVITDAICAMRRTRFGSPRGRGGRRKKIAALGLAALITVPGLINIYLNGRDFENTKNAVGYLDDMRDLEDEGQSSEKDYYEVYKQVQDQIKSGKMTASNSAIISDSDGKGISYPSASTEVQNVNDIFDNTLDELTKIPDKPGSSSVLKEISIWALSKVKGYDVDQIEYEIAVQKYIKADLFIGKKQAELDKLKLQYKADDPNFVEKYNKTSREMLEVTFVQKLAELEAVIYSPGTPAELRSMAQQSWAAVRKEYAKVQDSNLVLDTFKFANDAAMSTPTTGEADKLLGMAVGGIIKGTEKSLSVKLVDSIADGESQLLKFQEKLIAQSVPLKLKQVNCVGKIKELKKAREGELRNVLQNYNKVMEVSAKDPRDSFKIVVQNGYMRHILERHHPQFWDFSLKPNQSFFLPNTKITDIERWIKQVTTTEENVKKISQLKAQLRSTGRTAVSEDINAVINGQKYVAGITVVKKGEDVVVEVHKFYPWANRKSVFDGPAARR